LRRRTSGRRSLMAVLLQTTPQNITLPLRAIYTEWNWIVMKFLDFAGDQAWPQDECAAKLAP